MEEEINWDGLDALKASTEDYEKTAVEGPKKEPISMDVKPTFVPRKGRRGVKKVGFVTELVEIKSSLRST